MVEGGGIGIVWRGGEGLMSWYEMFYRVHLSKLDKNAAYHHHTPREHLNPKPRIYATANSAPRKSPKGPEPVPYMSPLQHAGTAPSHNHLGRQIVNPPIQSNQESGVFASFSRVE